MASKRKVNPQLEAARTEVKRLQRNANAKVSRLRAKGIDIARTGYDPRASDFKKIGRYTAKQLIAYGNKLQEFNNRENGYVAGVGGVPLSKSEVSHLEDLVSKHNAIGRERMSERGDIKIPGAGLTVQERDETFTYRGKRANGAGGDRPYSPVEFKAHNINGPEALAKLIKSMEKKLNRKYLPAVLKKQRDSFAKAVELVGSDELKKAVKGLTHNQFDILFNDSGFAKDFFQRYGVIMAMATGGTDRWYSAVVEEGLEDVIESIEWAKTLPKTRGKGSPDKR